MIAFVRRKQPSKSQDELMDAAVTGGDGADDETDAAERVRVCLLKTTL
jgi:hypothetical protein